MIYYDIIVNWCRYCVHKDCKFHNEPCMSCSKGYLMYESNPSTPPSNYKREE